MTQGTTSAMTCAYEMRSDVDKLETVVYEARYDMDEMKNVV